MKAKALGILLLMVAGLTKGQQFSQGIQLNLPIASMMHFEQNYYLPQNYYGVYFVNDPGKNERYNWFNFAQAFGRRHKNLGGGIGYNMKLSRGRFSLRLGYRLKYNASIIKLNQYAGGFEEEIVDEYKAAFKTELFQHQYPVNITFNLKRQNDAPYIVLGAEPGYIFGKIEKSEWEYNIFTDRIKVPYLYGHLYNEKPYVYGVTGYGFRKKRFEFDFVFKYRIDKNGQSLTMNEYIVDFNMTYYFKGITVQKKKFIYTDEQ